MTQEIRKLGFDSLGWFWVIRKGNKFMTSKMRPKWTVSLHEAHRMDLESARIHIEGKGMRGAKIIDYREIKHEYE